MPRPARGASRSGPASEPGDSAPLSSPGSESCSASSEPGRDLEAGIGLLVGPPGAPEAPSLSMAAARNLRTALIFGGFISLVGAAFYPIYFRPLMRLEEYRE